MIATGYFAAADEATRVLTELMELHYTAAQLRFAFLALLEQDASPITLYKRFEKNLVQDVLDRGHSLPSARHSVQTLLHLSAESVGETFDIGQKQAPAHCAPQGVFQPPSLTSQDALQAAQQLCRALAKDSNQCAAASAITASIRASQNFVHGAAGTG